MLKIILGGLKMDENKKIFDANVVIWKCSACDTSVTKQNKEDGISPIGLMLGPLPVLICPYCRSITVSEEVFDSIIQANKKRIITPENVVGLI